MEIRSQLVGADLVMWADEPTDGEKVIADQSLSLESGAMKVRRRLRLVLFIAGATVTGLLSASLHAATAAMRRVLCVHFPHKLSGQILTTLSHPRIIDMLKLLIGPNLKCMQSMLFVKAAGKPGQAWHQDEDFIPTRDRSLAGAWIAMDDATVENGCLWVLPGSQTRGILWPQRNRSDTRFDCTHESWNFPWQDEDSIPVEVKAGSVVFFNGYLLHRSLPNRSQSDFRRTLVNHYMSAESLLPWVKPADKTSIALADYRDVVLVAGTDPYAYKGVESVASAFVRPDLGGGCVDWNDDDQKAMAAEHARQLTAEKSASAR